MTLKELRERLAALAEQAKEIQTRADAEKRDITEAEEGELEQVFADFDNTEKEIERRERLQAIDTRMEAGTGRRTDAGSPQASALDVSDDARIQVGNFGERGRWGFRDLGEFAAAVHNAAAPNGAMDGRLLNAPTTSGTEGTGADGGFAVPPDFRQTIMKKIEGEESLLSRTDSMPSSSNSMTMPRDEETPWGSTGIQAYWDGEQDQINQSKPNLKQTQIRLNRLTCLVPMTEELLEDAPAMTGYLNSKVPEVFDSKINTAIIAGTGAGMPRGILEGGDLVTVAKESAQVADTVVYENINNMWTRLYAPSRRNAIWMINQDIEPQLNSMLLLVKNVAGAENVGGVPVYLPANGLSGSPYATLMGRPVIPVEACKTLGDKGDIILGDLSKYLTLVKTGGIRADVSIHLWFDYATTAFRFIFRVAGQPHFSSTITPQNGTATRGHFVALAERA